MTILRGRVLRCSSYNDPRWTLPRDDLLTSRPGMSPRYDLLTLSDDPLSYPHSYHAPLAYQDCYLYAQSHAPDIDTPSYMIMLTGESACTRQTNTRTAVHRDPHVTM